MQKAELDINVSPVKAGNVKFIDRRSSPARPGNGQVTALNRCPQCACPDAQQILSRHQTTDGLLTYTRCRCGALHLWLSPQDATARHIARGGHVARSGHVARGGCGTRD
jgi:hypothetical protein